MMKLKRLIFTLGVVLMATAGAMEAQSQTFNGRMSTLKDNVMQLEGALTEDQIACPKKGVMSAASHCRAFQYDPLRRTPPRPVTAQLTGLKDEDFSL